MATEQELRAVKHRHSMDLLKLPGVSGVGIERDETGDYVLTVHLDADMQTRAQLPADLEGHPIRYRHSGPFTKLPACAASDKED